jgi:hypothetical protein
MRSSTAPRVLRSFRSGHLNSPVISAWQAKARLRRFSDAEIRAVTAELSLEIQKTAVLFARLTS